ncbi:MAG: hypothetical protein CL424_20385 [Acidimicrobiaceae bacterium]|nr:hypothetical protein [Acidimicrobiaceae bacterium]
MVVLSLCGCNDDDDRSETDTTSTSDSTADLVSNERERDPFADVEPLPDVARELEPPAVDSVVPAIRIADDTAPRSMSVDIEFAREGP